jgi:hypothetical protein
MPLHGEDSISSSIFDLNNKLSTSNSSSKESNSMREDTGCGIGWDQEVTSSPSDPSLTTYCLPIIGPLASLLVGLCNMCGYHLVFNFLKILHIK